MCFITRYYKSAVKCFKHHDLDEHTTEMLPSRVGIAVATRAAVQTADGREASVKSERRGCAGHHGGYHRRVLIGVTWWYATLTRRMASTMEQQLAASLHPDIEMTLMHRFQGRGTNQGMNSESVSGTIVVKNNGDLPFKIVSGRDEASV